VTLPWRIYEHDTAWVPPLIQERLEFIDPRKHPFYCHGAAVQFLARQHGRVVGRIQASDDPRYNDRHRANTGHFGLFESRNEPAVASALLDAAASWVAARGRSNLLGPVDYSMNYGCGLLIDGFDTPPRVMMNHNPPYYEALLTRCELRPAKDLYCWWFDDRLDLGEKWRARAGRLHRRRDITVRTLNLDDLEAELRRVQQVYNNSWQKSWGFVDLTGDEIRYLALRLKQIAEPELLLLAIADDEPVAICLSLPDVNEALRVCNGRLTRWGLPVGLVKFLLARRRVRTCRLFALGIVQTFRRRGILELMILKTLENAKNRLGYSTAELGWTLEDNRAINGAIEAVGGVRYKTYRIYQKNLADERRRNGRGIRSACGEASA